MQNTAIKVRFLGGGNMAHSLIGGLINQGFMPAQITATDPHTSRCELLHNELGIAAWTDNQRHFGTPDVLVLAVKPQTMQQALNSVRTLVEQTHPLIISIAAGIRIEQISKWLSTELAIVRTMPNTPALIGMGATGMYANEAVTGLQKHLTERIMDSVGLSVWVDEESQLDAVTALSGSGPAYFFYMLEALEQAGRDMGLPERIITRMTEQTAVGATLLAQRSPHSFAELRRQVTSPRGTTERAIGELEQAHYKDLLIQAVRAAEHRSAELSSEYDE